MGESATVRRMFGADLAEIITAAGNIATGAVIAGLGVWGVVAGRPNLGWGWLVFWALIGATGTSR